MLELFREKAEALMAEVHSFSAKTEALEFIKTFLREHSGANRSGGVVWHNTSFLDDGEKEQLSAELPWLSFEITPELAREAMIGINEADGAIAETGSLIEVSDDIKKRLASTLPEIHISILYTDLIHPDLKSAIKFLALSSHSYVAFISGPSRTADIERVLTIGVHGPERLVIVCVDR